MGIERSAKKRNGDVQSLDSPKVGAKKDIKLKGKAINSKKETKGKKNEEVDLITEIEDFINDPQSLSAPRSSRRLKNKKAKFDVLKLLAGEDVSDSETPKSTKVSKIKGKRDGSETSDESVSDDDDSGDESPSRKLPEKKRPKSPEPEKKRGRKSPEQEKKAESSSSEDEGDSEGERKSRRLSTRRKAVKSPEPDKKKKLPEQKKRKSPEPGKKKYPESSNSSSDDESEDERTTRRFPARKRGLKSPEREKKKVLKSPEPEKKKGRKSPEPEKKKVVKSPEAEKKKVKPEPEKKKSLRSSETEKVEEKPPVVEHKRPQRARKSLKPSKPPVMEKEKSPEVADSEPENVNVKAGQVVKKKVVSISLSTPSLPANKVNFGPEMSIKRIKKESKTESTPPSSDAEPENVPKKKNKIEKLLSKTDNPNSDVVVIFKTGQNHTPFNISERKKKKQRRVLFAKKEDKTEPESVRENKTPLKEIKYDNAFDRYFSTEERICEHNDSLESDSSEEQEGLLSHFINLKGAKSSRSSETSINDLMQEISAELPSWNVHTMSDNGNFALVQIDNGPMGMPRMKKLIVFDSDFNVRVYVNEKPLHNFTGIYDSYESIKELIYSVDHI